MILVVGANGILGKEICMQLVTKRKQVRGMVRRLFENEKTVSLKNMGIQLVQGDLRNPHNFNALLSGVSTVICTASSIPYSYVKGVNTIHEVDQEGIINLIDACTRSKVTHFIFISLSGNISLDLPLRNAKRTVEQYLLHSGISYTILRPCFFMETWFKAFCSSGSIDCQARIYGKGTNPVSFISYKNVAEYAVRSITNPYAKNNILELGGPEKLTQHDAVSILQNAGIVGYKTDEMSFDNLRIQFKYADDPMQKSLLGLRICLAKGDTIDTENLRKAFHIKLTALKEYAKTLAVV